MGYATGEDAPALLSKQSRGPRRVSVTLSYRTFQALEERSRREGRSLSNLAAFLLEKGLEEEAENP
jgi:macrodomain Ter protein organizer (MatP/YcbG family)